MGTCQMLGYHAKFLALNDSFSLFTSGFQYLNRNAIHFADDNASNFDWKNKSGEGKDLGVFNLDDHSIETFDLG